jgi:hypothetical protein
MRREQNYHPQGSPESASYRFHEAKIIKKAKKRRATGDEATEGEREQRTREHGTGNMGTWEHGNYKLVIPNCELVIPNFELVIPNFELVIANKLFRIPLSSCPLTVSPAVPFRCIRQSRRERYPS